MQGNASKYLVGETAGSGIVNGLLNFASAYAIFHGHIAIPAVGPGSLLRDSIGETFIVSFLSVLIPSFIARHRGRAGKLPVSPNSNPKPAGNLWVRALTIGLIFTAVGVSCNALLLPRMFSEIVSLRDVLLFKTFYGALIGSIATFLAVQRVLAEAH